MSSFEKIKPLPIDIGHINGDNIEQLKMINVNTLPVRYAPKFYKDILDENHVQYIYDRKYLRLAHWNGFAVGAVCARLEPIEGEEGYNMYIMTINVLAAYRRRGIASTLLKYTLENAAQDTRVKMIHLHVQTSNEEAKAFYLHHGFEEIRVVEDYYKRIEPTSAFFLTKKNDYQVPGGEHGGAE